MCREQTGNTLKPTEFWVFDVALEQAESWTFGEGVGGSTRAPMPRLQATAFSASARLELPPVFLISKQYPPITVATRGPTQARLGRRGFDSRSNPTQREDNAKTTQRKVYKRP